MLSNFGSHFTISSFTRRSESLPQTSESLYWISSATKVHVLFSLFLNDGAWHCFKTKEAILESNASRVFSRSFTPKGLLQRQRIGKVMNNDGNQPATHAWIPVVTAHWEKTTPWNCIDWFWNKVTQDSHQAVTLDSDNHSCTACRSLLILTSPACGVVQCAHRKSYKTSALSTLA